MGAPPRNNTRPAETKAATKSSGSRIGPTPHRGSRGGDLWAGTRPPVAIPADPGPQGEAARDAAGWQVCLDRLVARLWARPGAGSTAEQWGPVHSMYVQEFGPAAATIGPPEDWQEGQGG